MLFKCGMHTFVCCVFVRLSRARCQIRVKKISPCRNNTYSSCHACRPIYGTEQELWHICSPFAPCYGKKCFGLQPRYINTQLASQPSPPWLPPAEMAPEWPTWSLASRANASNGWALPPMTTDINFGGIEAVYGPQSAPLIRQWCMATTLENFEGHTHTQHPKELYLLAQQFFPYQAEMSEWSPKPHGC